MTQEQDPARAVMSGAVELEAELRAGLDRFERAAMAYERLGKITRDDDKSRKIRKDVIAELGSARSDLLATLRADNERLTKKYETTFQCYEGAIHRYEAAEAERYTLLAQVGRVERVLCDLDPENAIDDSLLRDIHARLQVHGEKYPDRAVSVLHRNVVFYAIQAAVRAALTKEPS